MHDLLQVSVNQAIYDCDCSSSLCYCPYSNSASYYRLHHLFDQTLRTSASDYFMVESGSATLTITLTQQLHINKIKVYPTIAHYTKFKVCCFFVHNQIIFCGIFVHNQIILR